MKLSVATHFGQGPSYGEQRADTLLDMVIDSGASGIRDGISWASIETSPGVYDFSAFTSSYMALVADSGLDVTLSILPGGNPLYDDGHTVTTAEGRAAFAAFVDALLTEFPSIDRIVIGNEFNGLNAQFVDGPAASKSIPERAAIYTDILAEVSDLVAEKHSQVEIGGGALHSVATGYVQALIDAGAFAYMDTLDLHPYGLDPVEVGTALAQLGKVLDQLPEDQRPELVVTEFGASADSADPLSNAEFLAKMAAVLSAGGVSEASWYALLDEDSSGTPDMGLYDTISTENDMLEGFRFVQSILLDDQPVQELDLGPGIEAYDFGGGTWLVWGSLQDVDFTGTGLVFRDASGAVIAAPDQLTDSPIYLQGENVDLLTEDGPGSLIADSFYDWALDADPDGPWSYHMLKIRNGTEHVIDTEVLDGQTRMGEQWNPYLGSQYARPFSITADTVLPAAFGGTGNNDRAALERFTAEQTGTVDIVASWSVSADSDDGVIVELRLNGETLSIQTVTGHFALVVRALALTEGDQLDFIVHDGANAVGDVTARHIRVLQSDAGVSSDALLQAHLGADLIDGNEGHIDSVVIGDHLVSPDGGLEADATDPEPQPEIAEETQISGTAEGDLLSADDAVNTKITGRGGEDTLLGNSGNDTLVGGAGADQLNGGSGNDMITGGTGNDLLMGGDGTDKLNGSAGDDTLIGGGGDDQLVGGDGADVFVLAMGDGTDILRDLDATQGDRIDLTAFDADFSDLHFEQSGKHVQVSLTTDGDAFSFTVLSTTVDTLNDEGLFLL